MVRHIAMFRFTNGATPAQVQHLADGLAEMPALVPTIVAYTFGADLGANEGNFDYAVVADFADLAGYLTYCDHPAHQALIRDRIAPIRAERSSVQFGYGS